MYIDINSKTPTFIKKAESNLDESVLLPEIEI